MGKNIVVCLDGTGGQVNATGSSNVVRLFEVLDLTDDGGQIAYYDPGVGTFSAHGAWTPAARWFSRMLGLATGVGMRENLAEAYTFLMQHWEPGDRVFLFGFSRGAYTVRALAGMLYRIGLLRPGCENLVQYAVNSYARNKQQWEADDWKQIDRFAAAFSVRQGGSLAVPVEFLGVWDTVKAAGILRRDLKWPYTRQLPNARTVWHAVSIDEKRRPFREYLVQADPARTHLNEVWFAGVHSDVGGTFVDDSRLADMSLQWMIDGAVTAGMKVDPATYRKHRAAAPGDALGEIHQAGWPWGLLGFRRRSVPDGATLHPSVRLRISQDASYQSRIPRSPRWEDELWPTPPV